MRTGPASLALALALLAAAASALAEEAPYAVGDRIAPIELADQHGTPRSIDASTRFVLFSRDMDGGDLLREAVADQDAASLAKLGAVYVADIHRMPGLVARWIAVPRMRERRYPVLLDREGEATARLPDREGEVTVLELDALVLRAVHHLDSVAAVRAQLGLRAPASAD